MKPELPPHIAMHKERGAGYRILILMCTFVLMFIVVSMIGGMVKYTTLDPRTQTLIVSALQALLAFALPSIVVAMLGSGSPLCTLSLDGKVGWRPILFAALTLIVAIPAMNQLVFWNENMHLPQSMAATEELFRKWEETSERLTQMLLSVKSVGGLISGVMVIGVITGFGEEMFFRAGLQRLLAQCINRDAAIWVSAVVFSTMHFEFFGFVPRLLLGAFFGYLYVWSGSIWVAIFGHALNNSLVVISAWIAAKWGVDGFDMLGVSEHGISALAIFSTLAVAAALIFFRNKFAVKHNGKES